MDTNFNYIKANELKIKNYIFLENGYWMVTNLEHVKPGKGGAFKQTKLQNILTGNHKEVRFGVDDKVKLVIIKEHKGDVVDKRGNLLSVFVHDMNVVLDVYSDAFDLEDVNIEDMVYLDMHDDQIINIRTNARR